MGNKLIITKHDGMYCSALFRDKTMVQVHLDREEQGSILGNIYVGIVQNVVKNLDAAFIEIQKGMVAYFSMKENPHPIFLNQKNTDKVCQGDRILVQVSKENIKTKAPLVTCKINITGKYLVLARGRESVGISGKIGQEERRSYLRQYLQPFCKNGYGFIVRTNSLEAEDEKINAERERLEETYQRILDFGIHRALFSLLYQAPTQYICDIRDMYLGNIDKICTDREDIWKEIKEYIEVYQPEDFDKLNFYQDDSLSLSRLYGIETKIMEARKEKVWLKSGGTIVIQPTEALTVIDVNTGKAVKGKKATEAHFLQMNLEAAKEIAAQIRLRNLSGIIIVDFIDMEMEDNRLTLLEEIKKYCSCDPIPTKVVDMTVLHLVEITRKKVRKPLHEQM